jgi:hypothetical protein
LVYDKGENRVCVKRAMAYYYYWENAKKVRELGWVRFYRENVRRGRFVGKKFSRGTNFEGVKGTRH